MDHIRPECAMQSIGGHFGQSEVSEFIAWQTARQNEYDLRRG